MKSRITGVSLDETIPIGGADLRRPDTAIRVRILDAPARPASFRLTEKTLTVGKGEDCDVVIDEPTISRAHLTLTLTPEGDAVAVTDLGSKNGTFYLGQRIEKARIKVGAIITLAGDDVRLALEPDHEDDAALPYDRNAYRSMIGASAPIRAIFGTLKRLESSLTTILVEGESGVGKEVVARVIHEGSQVAAGPLVILNCGALPRELIASELFGHKRGAFTGATESRKGAFEAADGGTLFLDEIGELPLDLQPSLLRAVELGEIRPLGTDASRKVNVRLVTATNRDLEAEIQEGRFREDLFYRLAVVRLVIPPLRERVEDIEPLANAFARTAGLDALPAAVIEQLKGRTWPGNVRELRNVVQAYAALGVLPPPTRSRVATLNLGLRELIDPREPYADQKEQFVDRFTRAYLERILESTGGNQTAAARIAGLDRGYVGKLVQKYGLARPGTKP